MVVFKFSKSIEIITVVKDARHMTLQSEFESIHK